MTHEVVEIESKDAGRVHVLVGTIGEIYSDSDETWTADVDIDDYGIIVDVPAFYNCQDKETATLMPFSKDDRVLIINSGDAVNLSAADMKIIGFEDGLPMSCGTPAFLDGIIWRRDWYKTWSFTRDNSLGILSELPSHLMIYAGYENPPSPLTYYYNISRTFINFDLSLLTRTVKAATLRIYNNLCPTAVSDAIQIMVQEGTQGDNALAADDFNSFVGLSFADILWDVDYRAINDFVFSAAGIAYINSVIGSKAKFCLREYTHDFLNVAPINNKHVFGYSIAFAEEAMIGQLILF